MKKITHAKIAVHQTFAILIVLVAIISCDNHGKMEDTKKIAEEHNDFKFDNTNREKDAQFFVNAAEINLEEIQLGQLAQQRSKMDDVKQLGKMMEDAHLKSLNELIVLSNRKSITIPTSLTDNAKEAYNKLTNTLDVDFDKEYCNMMVTGHRKAIEIFDKASTESTDTDIKAWATSMLVNLHSHLDYAISCQIKYDKIK